MRGLLVKPVPVRLVNLSLSGFLLESDSAIEVGSTGLLRVDLGDGVCHDDVRVARAVTRAGSSMPYQVGGEFSWASRPDQDSVRLVVRSFDGERGES